MKFAANILLFISLLLFMMCGSSTADLQSTPPMDSSPDTTKNSSQTKTFAPPLHISFASEDGIAITADSYVNSDSLPWILLCHQAGYSRGEYRETAPLFRELGFNCLAIDQRSGKEVNGVKNETAERALAAGKPTEYLDAEQDIRAAVNYLYEYSKKPVIIVSSSYSCGLALKIANGNPIVKAVLAFSPGEYYGRKFNLTQSVSTLNIPVFFTCAKSEMSDAQKIFDAIPAQKKLFYEPSVAGIHGSKCLWAENEGHEQYWSAVKEFLAGIK